MSLRLTSRLWQISRPSRGLALPILLVLLITAGCARPAPGALRVQAELLAQAQQRPHDTLRVIVQERGASDAPEALVARSGGAVLQELSLINGFAAELPAAALPELASLPGVRWISLDATMRAADAADAPWPAFVTWATTYTANDGHPFSKHANLVDSALGPVGTYAVGSRAKSRLGGFEAEVTAGHHIVKVEAAIAGYVTEPIDKPAVVSSYIDGVKIADVVVGGPGAEIPVGSADPILAYVDVTGGRQWLWSDFGRNVEVALDFTSFGVHDRVYIDAVGLRVWIAPGADESSAPLPPAAPPTRAPDTRRQVNVYNNVIGVEALWNADHHLQGQGVGVAVVDSGVEKTGDLAQQGGIDVNFNRGFHDSKDRYGHGTFVAAVVAGNGAGSHGVHLGVAPRVQLINVRVSDDSGMATTLDVLAGLQWVLQNKDVYNIRVVNLSLNSSVAASYMEDPLCAAAEALWLNGIVVVVSAGNNGTATLYPPANDPFVITVGATDDAGTTTLADDTVAAFSGYGVSEAGLPKPELVAPGRNIIGYLPNNGALKMAQRHGAHRVTDSYFRMSGTSVAAPMVTGAVALLLQDEPGLSPNQVKQRLMATANRNWPGYDPVRAGAGYVNVWAAVYGSSLDEANAGIAMSRLLWEALTYAMGVDIDWETVDWSSVNWNSVNWNSVNWNSVNWNSVNWNSVNWNSDHWEEMAAASPDSVRAVSRLLHLLESADEAETPSALYLPAISR